MEFQNNFKLKFMFLAFVTLQLQDCTAIYSRVSLGVNLSVWSIGYAIAYHARKLFQSTGYGLGLNMMQGNIYSEYVQCQERPKIVACVLT